MDRRQRKTREAIFSAFTRLISKKSYEKITVNDIIEEADIGRATFYAHFETKDYLLREMCGELFGHIVDTAVGITDGRIACELGSSHDSVFLHLLRHIKADDGNVLTLFSSENNEIFMKYFKNNLMKLTFDCFKEKWKPGYPELPVDYAVNFIASTFAETVRWWIDCKMKYPPEEVNRYFEIAVSSAAGFMPSRQSCN